MEIRMKETKQTQKNKKSRTNDTLREGVAYLIFGVLTTVIDYAISNFLFYIVHMASIPAQTIAWIAAVLFAFVTNKWWVFNSRSLNPMEVWREFVSFVLCRVATFLFNLAALFILGDLMGMEFFICKLAISVVVVVLNYIFSKILIFSEKKDNA